MYKGAFENDKYDGKYRDIEAEFVHLFSDKNKIEVDEDGETSVTSSLICLKNGKYNYSSRVVYDGYGQGNVMHDRGKMTHRLVFT